VDAFNKQRVRRVSPGKWLLVDELMSMWLGLERAYHLRGMPHVTKIPRKPRSVGVEVRAVGCVQTGWPHDPSPRVPLLRYAMFAKHPAQALCFLGICLQLEICEGKDAMQKKAYGEHPSGAASVLRLVAPWKGSGRTVLGDSAFASVYACWALFTIHRLYFIGPVKTATALFPVQYIAALPTTTRGSHVTLTATYKDVNLLAMAWDDHTRKSLVGTAGTSLPATPAERTRYWSLTKAAPVTRT
jgi:hypothetical protein